MPASFKSVFSSHIDEIGYDDETRELTVRWDGDGGTTVYRGVPHEVAKEVWHAPSIGEALHRHIRGKFDFLTHRGKPDTEGGATR